ncbi:MAG: transposase [Chloroflexi bacterium]|nr:transposase [Chloroflexota bacterium]
MVWSVVRQVFSTLLELIQIGRLSDQEKALEILVLRKQLAMMEQQLDKPVRLSRAERLTLAVIGAKLKAVSGRSIKQLRDVLRIVQPETVLRWHRELVRRKWAQPSKNAGGRPRTQREIERLVVRFARQNVDWGYGKIQGELLKLDIDISAETIANILERYGIPPAPERGTSPSWRHLMTHYKEQLLACDFFTVETLFLQTIYVFFFIEVGTRCVHFAGCTPNPSGAWVTQQARQVVWNLEEHDPAIRFLIRDNDTKFTTAFDTVFRAEGIDIIRTPYCAPNANAFAERWVRTVRDECLNKLLIINQTHLRRVMREFVAYHNSARPHQGIDQQIPVSQTTPVDSGPVRCRNVLGGIIHDYYREAA